MNDLLRQLMQDVVDSADDDGCSDDLTVASKAAIDGLAVYLAANPPGPKDPIVVVLSEGQVENVQIPYEGCVEVRDYDAVDDYLEYTHPEDQEPLEDWTEVDENGERYAPRVWEECTNERG